MKKLIPKTCSTIRIKEFHKNREILYNLKTAYLWTVVQWQWEDFHFVRQARVLQVPL